MTDRHTKVLIALMALLPSACGGGGSSYSGGSSSAAAIPTTSSLPGPISTPTPMATQGTFGALGQTASQSFAVLGYGYRTADDDLDYPTVDPASFDPNIAIGFRFAAPAALFLSIAGYGEGGLSTDGSSGSHPVFGLTSLGYNVLGGNAKIFSAYNPDATSTLKSTAFSSWIKFSSTDPKFPYQLVYFVYGVPTPQSGIPQTGSAVYKSYTLGNYRLNVDFAGRTVTGDLVLGDPGATVTYRLSNGVLASDGTFRAATRADGSTKDGVLDGRLTGTAAEEIMLRLILTDPNGKTQYISVAGSRI